MGRDYKAFFALGQAWTTAHGLTLPLISWPCPIGEGRHTPLVLSRVWHNRNRG
jgi:hypothetical protein